MRFITPSTFSLNIFLNDVTIVVININQVKEASVTPHMKILALEAVKEARNPPRRREPSISA